MREFLVDKVAREQMAAMLAKDAKKTSDARKEAILPELLPTFIKVPRKGPAEKATELNELYVEREANPSEHPSLLRCDKRHHLRIRITTSLYSDCLPISVQLRSLTHPRSFFLFLLHSRLAKPECSVVVQRAQLNGARRMVGSPVDAVHQGWSLPVPTVSRSLPVLNGGRLRRQSFPSGLINGFILWVRENIFFFKICSATCVLHFFVPSKLVEQEQRAKFRSSHSGLTTTGDQALIIDVLFTES